MKYSDVRCMLSLSSESAVSLRWCSHTERKLLLLKRQYLDMKKQIFMQLDQLGMRYSLRTT